MLNVNIIQLLRLLKELLPPEVYKRVLEVIIQLMENEDVEDFEKVSKELLKWFEEHYPQYLKLIEKILEGIRTASLGGVAEAAGIVLSGPLAILGGLYLVGRKWGEPKWDWGGWFRDPCAELLKQINDEFAANNLDNTDFNAKPTRKGAMAALGDTSLLINLCTRYLRDCGSADGAALVQNVLDIAEKRRDVFLDWLATH